MIRKTNEWKLPTEQLFRSDFVRRKHKRKKAQTLTHIFVIEKNIRENFSAGFRDKIVRARSSSLSHSCESCQLPLYRWSPVGCVCSQKCIESNKFCVGKPQQWESRHLFFYFAIIPVWLVPFCVCEDFIECLYSVEKEHEKYWPQTINSPRISTTNNTVNNCIIITEHEKKYRKGWSEK